jgi:drug/metabolite transporter (DMT)-like permease
VIAILGGLGAAACWTVTTLCASRASRQIGAGPTLAWVMLVGLAVVLPFLVAAGSPPTDSASGWLLLAGLGNVLGLMLEYRAVRAAKIGVVAAIVSTEGAMTALISRVAGERLPATTAAVLALIAVGVVLACLEKREEAGGRRVAPAVVLAAGAAVSFGISLYSIAHVSGDVAVPWLALPARAVGVAVIALPLAVRGRIRSPGSSAPLVIAAGVAEVAGIAVFAWGAREAIGVASVLAAQFAAFSAVGAYFLFKERLRRIQILGLAAILVGVGILALLRS